MSPGSGKKEIMHTNGPLHPRRSLASLPDELLRLIAYKLPLHSAISFGLVARRFAKIAERGIWRELPLFLPPDDPGAAMGDQTLSSVSSGPKRGAQAEAELVSRRCGEALKRKVVGVMIAADRQRLGMVEKVVVESRPEASQSTVILLDMVSPGLRELQLRAPLPEVWDPSAFGSLDVRCLGYGLAFPSLTHLSIHKQSVRFAEFIILLCHASPNLVALDADITNCTEFPDWNDSMVQDYDVHLASNTKLRYLRLAYEDREDDEQCEDDHPALHIIEHSPHLRQVSIQYHCSSNDIGTLLLRSLAGIKGLEDLDVSLSPEVFGECFGDVEMERGKAFPSLRRLVLGLGSDLDIFDCLPGLPALRILHLERSPDMLPRIPPKTSFPDIPSSPTMTPDFADLLHESPRLQRIHLLPPITSRGDFGVFKQVDEIEKGDRKTGIVRSLIHGKNKTDELLHARLFLHLFEQPHDTDADSSANINGVRLTFQARDNSISDKLWLHHPEREGAWQDFVAYDGYRVPMEVLSRMRWADGAGAATWQWRRVEVGAKAWNVLRDWRDAQPGSEQSMAEILEERKRTGYEST